MLNIEKSMHYHMIPLLYRILKKKIIQMKLYIEQRNSHTDTGTCLLYSTENYTQYFIITYKEKESEIYKHRDTHSKPPTYEQVLFQEQSCECNRVSVGTQVTHLAI